MSSATLAKAFADCRYHRFASNPSAIDVQGSATSSRLQEMPRIKICPLNSVIGDYKKHDKPQTPDGADKRNSDK